MKKILFIRTASDIGGAEILTKNISEKLSNEKDFLLYNYQFPKVINIKNSKVIKGKSLLEPGSGIKNYILFHILYIFYLKEYKKIRDMIKKENIDTVIIESFSDKLILTPLVKNITPKINIIWWEHGPFSNGKWFRFSFHLKYLYIRQVKNINTIIAVSSKTKEDLISIGVNKNKIKVIYPLVNIKIKVTEKKTEKFCVSFISRIEKSKGIYEYIDAFSLIKDSNIIGIIAGSGAETPNLISYIKNKNLQDRIKYLGFQKNIIPLLKKSNLVILPSINEGLGLILIESLSLSTPILATKIGGIPEVLEDRVNGMFIKKDPIDIAKKIEYLYKNKSVYNNLVKNSTKSISKFNSKVIINQWKGIL